MKMRNEISYNSHASSFIGFARIGLGWIFLWAFLDKLFGLGFSTASDKAWIVGGSPTSGFLGMATQGPFVSIFKSMAGSVLVDWLFMIGLLLLGLSLLMGVGVKVAGYSGALLMLLMWLAVLPPKNNPIIDDHIIYGLLLIFFSKSNAGRWIGLGNSWSKTKLVKKYPWMI